MLRINFPENSQTVIKIRTNFSTKGNTNTYTGAKGAKAKDYSNEAKTMGVERQFVLVRKEESIILIAKVIRHMFQRDKD